MWNLKGYTLKAQSLDTDVQRPFYSVAIVALLPYYVQRPFYSVAIVALLPYYVQRPFYSVAIVALLPFLNMGRERRWPRWIKKASHIGSKRLWIWAPIGSHHPFVIGWFRYRLWLPGVTMHCMLTWMVGIPTGPTQSPLLVHLHSRNDTKLPAFGLCKETVKESTVDFTNVIPDDFIGTGAIAKLFYDRFTIEYF